MLFLLGLCLYFVLSMEQTLLVSVIIILYHKVPEVVNVEQRILSHLVEVLVMIGESWCFEASVNATLHDKIYGVAKPFTSWSGTKERKKMGPP